MIEELYISLGEYLTSDPVNNFLQTSGLPDIAHIDLWEKQPDSEAEINAYSLPAVFLDFRSSTVEEDDFMLVEEYEIDFKIESKVLGSTAFNSHNRSKSLEHVRLLQALKTILQNYRYFKAKPNYLGQELQKKNDNNPVSTLRFSLILSSRKDCLPVIE